MNTLTKKVLRDLYSLKWRGVAISLITALGVADFSGSFMARDSLAHTRDYYYDSLKLADLDVHFTAADAQEMPSLPITGTKHVARFVYQASLDMADKEPVSIVLIHQHQTDRFAVNDVRVVDGSRLKNSDKEGILIDLNFAEAHGFKVGDMIGIRSIGHPIQFTVRGIVVTPEYLVPMGSDNEMIPIKGSLGVAFATMGPVEETFGYPIYNNLSFLFDTNSGADKASVLKTLKGLEVSRSLSRKDQFSYKWLEQALTSFNIFTPAVVFLFSIVVFVVTLMVFNRFVYDQKREIGVLMALGYSRQRIFFAFLTISLVLGLIGAIGGMVLAPLVCRAWASSTASYLGMPKELYCYPFQHFIGGFLIGLFLPIVSSIPPLFELFRLTPQQAIRNTASRGNFAKNREFLATVRFRSLVVKYGVRNLVRRPAVSIATVSLIAFAVAIMTAFYASTQSWTYYANKALNEEKWDIVSTFRVPLALEEAQKSWSIKGLTKVRPFISKPVVVRGKTFTKDFILNADDDMRGNTELEFTEGGYFTSRDGFEVIFSKVDRLPVKVGDRVRITLEKKEYSFKIVGILNRVTTGFAHIPKETARRLLQDKVSGFFANTSLSSEEIKRLLYQDENIAWVHPKSDIKTAVLDFLSQAVAVTKISLWISIFMATLFLLTGISISIKDREGEYAILRTLGYSDIFVGRVILLETTVQGVLGLLVSVPIAFIFSKYLNYEIAKAYYQMDLYFGARELLEVIALAFAFLPLAALPGIRRIVKLSIPVAVRTKSYG